MGLPTILKDGYPFDAFLEIRTIDVKKYQSNFNFIYNLSNFTILSFGSLKSYNFTYLDLYDKKLSMVISLESTE